MTVSQFLYNGKERQDELGLDWQEYGVRMHMPDIGRFMAIDLLADQYSFQSPYAYAANNPISFIDMKVMGPGDPHVLNGVYYVPLARYSMSFVERSAQGRFTQTVKGMYDDTNRSDYYVNLQQYKGEFGNSKPMNVFMAAFGSAPGNWPIMGQNVDNGVVTGSGTDNSRAYFAMGKDGSMQAGLGNPPSDAKIAFGGGIPIVINGQKYESETVKVFWKQVVKRCKTRL